MTAAVSTNSNMIDAQLDCPKRANSAGQGCREMADKRIFHNVYLANVRFAPTPDLCLYLPAIEYLIQTTKNLGMI
jgi:hypothetical protein